MPDSEPSLEERAIRAWATRRLLPKAAARQLLAATEALTLACVASLARLRETGGYARLLAENRHLRSEIAALRSENRILRGREENVTPRHRRRYSPALRFAILEHMRAHLLCVRETAERFLVTPQTLYNWLGELERNPEATTIGSLLRPTPPIRRYHDVGRRLSRRMKATGFGGYQQIALSLARFGWEPSRRTIGRFCKEKETPTPRPPAPEPSSSVRKETTVRGRYPSHLWLADLTTIPTVFPFLHLHVALVLDAFSRMPLASAVYLGAPCASHVLALVETAIRRHGTPRHFVSDKGSQFTEELRQALERRGVRPRYGKVGEHGSIALIERVFRTLKEDLHVIPAVRNWRTWRIWKPWTTRDLEHRLHAALVRYAYCRPHSALEGRVPAEVFFGIPDQRPLANLMPRGQPSAPDIDCPVDIAFLDPEDQTLPILVPKAA